MRIMLGPPYHQLGAANESREMRMMSQVVVVTSVTEILLGQAVQVASCHASKPTQIG